MAFRVEARPCGTVKQLVVPGLHCGAMRFAKLHGVGNDVVLFDLRAGGAPLPSARAVELCDRHRGIGADGVLTLLPGDRMLVQNADGSVPEMCGNGARCAALWIATEGCTRPGSGSMMLLTDAGPRPCTVEAAEARRGLVEVDMGIAVLSAPRRIGGVGAPPGFLGNPPPLVLPGPRRPAPAGGGVVPAPNSNT